MVRKTRHRKVRAAISGTGGSGHTLSLVVPPQQGNSPSGGDPGWDEPRPSPPSSGVVAPHPRRPRPARSRGRTVFGRNVNEPTERRDRASRPNERIGTEPTARSRSASGTQRRGENKPSKEEHARGTTQGQGPPRGDTGPPFASVGRAVRVVPETNRSPSKCEPGSARKGVDLP